VTDVEVLDRTPSPQGGLTTVRLWPRTGRPNQLRLHCAMIGRSARWGPMENRRYSAPGGGGGRTPCLLPTPPPSLTERRGTGVSTICPTAVTHGVIFFLRKDISRREVPHPPGCPHPIVGDDLVDDPEAPVEPSGARYRGRGLFLHCVLLDLPHPSAPDGRGPQPGIRRPPSLSPWRSHTQSFLTSGGQDG